MCIDVVHLSFFLLFLFFAVALQGKKPEATENSQVFKPKYKRKKFKYSLTINFWDGKWLFRWGRRSLRFILEDPSCNFHEGTNRCFNRRFYSSNSNILIPLDCPFLKWVGKSSTRKGSCLEKCRFGYFALGKCQTLETVRKLLMWK